MSHLLLVLILTIFDSVVLIVAPITDPEGCHYMSDLDSSLLLSSSGCSSREAVLLQHPPLDQVGHDDDNEDGNDDYGHGPDLMMMVMMMTTMKIAMAMMTMIVMMMGTVKIAMTMTMSVFRSNIPPPPGSRLRWPPDSTCQSTIAGDFATINYKSVKY